MIKGEGVSNQRSFEEREADYLKILSTRPSRIVIELAATLPGSGMDSPQFPIDPALNAAAQKLVRRADLQRDVAEMSRGGR